MKKLILLMLIICASLISFAQKSSLKIPSYLMPVEKDAEKIVVINMPFGKPDITSISGDTTGLRNAGDITIDLVYTDYPSSLSLEELNQKRLDAFYNLFSFIKKNQVQKICYLRQLDGSTKDNATDMFHGLVIRYRAKQTKETMKKDLSKLNEMLERSDSLKISEPETIVEPSDTSDIDTVGIKYSTVIIGKDSIIGILKDSTVSPKEVFAGCSSSVVPDFNKREKIFADADSMAIMKPDVALKRGILSYDVYKSYKDLPLITIYFRKDRWATGGDYLPLDGIDGASAFTINPYNKPDSTVFNIFKRNKWKNITVVGDVTGSMYPYTGQLLIWLKLNSLNDLTHRFAFFNDGDETPDDQKVIGSTGGIYSQRCDSFSQVKKLVEQTMMKGGGGDCPENDIEALLKTEKDFPEADCQILIADNWAPIKDKSLIDKLKKPVRVVLCGTDEYNVNVDYINLARQTKGSLHLMEKDLFDLAKMHEGETITIGKKTYKIVDDKFVDISDINRKM